jgi:FkbM family methyltransferase
MIEIMQILMQHPLGISAIPDMLGAVLYFREDELTVKSVAEFGVCNDWPTTSFSDYSIIHYCQPIDYKNGVRTHKSLPDFFDTLRTHPVDEIESANVATNKQLVRLVTNLFDADDGVVGSWKPGKIVNDAPQISKNHSDRNTVTGLETHSQVGQDRWVIETLGNQSSGFFVDIGAGDGIELSNTYLLEKRLGWRGIAVEPNPSFFERLQANRSCVKESSCIVSAQKDGGRFDLVLDGHLSAISDCCNKVLENSQEYRPRVSVAGISLAHLLDKYSAPRVIDYLSIDIEGGEYDVLKGFPFEQYTFQTITVEVNAYLGREQLCRRDDIRILLESNGYRFVRASDHLGIDDFYVYASVM